MANQPTITRRAALVGAIASSAALAVPAVAAVAPAPEDPYDRARRAGRELAQALADIENHPLCPKSQVAFVLPANGQNSYPIGFMDRDAYDEMISRLMTPDQAAAVAEYRRLRHYADLQWNGYLADPTKAGARASWETACFRREDAHIEMTRLFCPTNI